MDCKSVNYTPEWHNRLLVYMKSVYPHRDSQYLNWWLINIDNSGKECWEKCSLIVDGSELIGCTTVNKVLLNSEGIVEIVFFRGNTIISPSQRGKGISKLIYNQVNSFNNWLSFGVTDIAWKIQPKYVKAFTPIRPVNIYIAVNRNILYQFLEKVSGNKIKHCSFPDTLPMKKHDGLKKVVDARQLDYPKNGKWTSDSMEFVRDEDFFKKRYFDIYCSDRYAIYQYLSNGKSIGYVVLRATKYKGLDMLSLVDYRFNTRKDEQKAFKVASKIASLNKIGLVIALSSRKYGLCFSPFTIKMKKKLNCAVGMKDKVDQFNDMLITSADSDLDFVYYK